MEKLVDFTFFLYYCRSVLSKNHRGQWTRRQCKFSVRTFRKSGCLYEIWFPFRIGFWNKWQIDKESKSYMSWRRNCIAVVAFTRLIPFRIGFWNQIANWQWIEILSEEAVLWFWLGIFTRYLTSILQHAIRK